MAITPMKNIADDCNIASAWRPTTAGTPGLQLQLHSFAEFNRFPSLSCFFFLLLLACELHQPLHQSLDSHSGGANRDVYARKCIFMWPGSIQEWIIRGWGRGWIRALSKHGGGSCCPPHYLHIRHRFQCPGSKLNYVFLFLTQLW